VRESRSEGRRGQTGRERGREEGDIIARRERERGNK
jgi:hypothetical protein